MPEGGSAPVTRTRAVHTRRTAQQPRRCKRGQNAARSDAGRTPHAARPTPHRSVRRLSRVAMYPCSGATCGVRLKKRRPCSRHERRKRSPLTTWSACTTLCTHEQALWLPAPRDHRHERETTRGEWHGSVCIKDSAPKSGKFCSRGRRAGAARRARVQTGQKRR